MKIFIDSGDLKEIRDAAAMGVVDGVTTNPTLVAKVGTPLPALIASICEIVDGPISAEVHAIDCEDILREGRALAKIHENVVVKVPLLAAKAGAHVATLPHNVILQLLEHPLTAIGLEKFLADAKKIPHG